MKYEVRCECGRAHAVTGADAGATIACACGQTVEVPPLHRLRESVGQPSISPELQLQTLLVNGQLPDTDKCVVCGKVTDQTVISNMECERAEVKGNRADQVGGCLVNIFFRFIPGISPHVEVGDDKRVVGRDVRFLIPIRCCGGCAAQLTESVLRTALRRQAVCATVLNKYPHSKVTRYK